LKGSTDFIGFFELKFPNTLRQERTSNRLKIVERRNACIGKAMRDAKTHLCGYLTNRASHWSNHNPRQD